MTPQTALEVARQLKADNPNRRFAHNRHGNAVAFWSDQAQAWADLAFSEGSRWVILPAVIVLIDGQPAVAHEDWLEVLQ